MQDEPQKLCPYPYENKKYNRSCMFCGKHLRNVNMHVTLQRYFEEWLIGARRDAGLEVRDHEVCHLKKICL